jgi:tRNA threonylcarbamoyladenosine biosynthesis protein TsaB
MTNRFRLAVESSTVIGSLALGRGDEVLESSSLTEARNHARGFLPLAVEVCRRHEARPGEIEMVFVSAGPGSFTGLRIGVTMAKMLSLSNGCRLVAVPTLDVIAQNALCAGDSGSPAAPERVVVMLDAKRGRVYTASYVCRDGVYVAESAPIEANPHAYLEEQFTRSGPQCVIGEGVLYHREAIEASGAHMLDTSLYRPRPEVVYRLGCRLAAEGKFTDRRSLTPLYIRAPEAEEKWDLQRSNPRRKSPGLDSSGKPEP